MSLLQLPTIGRRLAARVHERRKEPRYAPAVEQARLGWWEGERFRVTSARLCNISNGGAALTVAGDAPATLPVWMSVVLPGPNDWILARVAGVSAAGEGAHCVRLSFVEPCPGQVFEAAVSGAYSAAAPPATAPPEAARPEILPRIRRKRRDIPCRHGAWGGPVQAVRPEGEKRKWSGLFDHLKYF